jgi:hypothetical protein
MPFRCHEPIHTCTLIQALARLDKTAPPYKQMFTLSHPYTQMFTHSHPYTQQLPPMCPNPNCHELWQGLDKTDPHDLYLNIRARHLPVSPVRRCIHGYKHVYMGVASQQTCGNLCVAGIPRLDACAHAYICNMCN